MNAFRALLIFMTLIVLAYTGLVVASHGWGLFSIFFGDIQSMNWPGQFNLDFSCLLILASLWLAWRNEFSTLGLVLGLFMLVGGTPFLAIYLFLASIRAKGDIKVLLVGETRAAD